MIILETPSAPLDAAQQFALDVLIDVARVLRLETPADEDAPAAVRLRVVDDGASTATVATMRASGWSIASGDGVVRITPRALSVLAEVVGARREQRSVARDRFGRVPSSENALVAEGTERTPVVQDAAAALGDAIVRSAGRRPVRFLAPWPRAARWAVAITHDLDVVAQWPVFTGLRVVELLRKGQVGQATAVASAALMAIGRDPVRRAVETILDIEREHAVSSTWFVLCGTPTIASRRAGDLTYLPESRESRALLQAIGAGGHEIGLHGSFATFENAEVFAAQRDRLARLTSAPVRGVRQHYVRMRPGATPAAMTAAGFTWDATFGFPDRNGFRLGAADVVPLWAEESGRPRALVELPFVWMDRALSKYQGVEEPDEWVHDALTLADLCRARAGVWSGIWHPNLTPALGFPGAPAAYRALVAGLAERAPWFATASEIVDWRAARRSARAIAVSGDGAIVLAAASPELRVEDAAGRHVASRVVRR